MKNTSTRILLTCAAIGVASGIVLLPIFGLFSSAVIAAVPLLYTVLLGFWFFGGVLSQSIMHRPGMALLTSVIAGLVISPFTPYGFSTVLSTATVGLCQELPFLVTLYRRWPAWLFYVANGVIGLGYAFPAQALFATSTPEVVRLVVYPLAAASAVAMTWLARLVAKRLERMGVTRGLRRAAPSSPSARAQPSSGASSSSV